MPGTEGFFHSFAISLALSKAKTPREASVFAEKKNELNCAFPTAASQTLPSSFKRCEHVRDGLRELLKLSGTELMEDLCGDTIRRAFVFPQFLDAFGEQLNITLENKSVCNARVPQINPPFPSVLLDLS